LFQSSAADIREFHLIRLNLCSDAVVDVFNRVVCHARLHKRVARILDRLIDREPQATALRVLSGNIYLQNRQFNLAAQTYAAALQQRPDDALLHLLLGLCFLETSAQRTGEERDRVHLIVLQAFGFLDQYARLSEQIGETARVVAEYNLARAYHAIGLNHLAVIAYERVLGAGAAGESVRVCAAHNLAKIYVESDNVELARRVLYTFNTVE
jgi:predicted Zn-dependent protease